MMRLGQGPGTQNGAVGVTAQPSGSATFGHSTSLAADLVEAIDGAQEKVWLIVPWWHRRERPWPAKLFSAVCAAANRGLDVRVMTRNDGANYTTIAALTQAGVAVRPLRYVHMKELHVDDRIISLSANFTTLELGRNLNTAHDIHGPDRDATAAAFVTLWGTRAAEAAIGEEAWTDPAVGLPPEMVPLIGVERLNPLQSKAIPLICATNAHTVVVAPTGAGKTHIGEAAALRAIRIDHRRAVWVAPARALTRELLDGFRRFTNAGIRVVEVTGGEDVDVATLRGADLWVTTIEKFESLCRRTSLSTALAEVGCVVVDEIHMVGAPQRGPTLEALLARLRTVADTTRIVGLSATVANANDISDWLGAELVESTWRPVQLAIQVVGYDPGETKWSDQEARTGKVRELIAEIRGKPPIGDDPSAGERDAGSPPAWDGPDIDAVDGGEVDSEADVPQHQPGQVIVFCGTVQGAKRTAADLAGVVFNVYANDDDGLARACRAGGVGLTFRGLADGPAGISGFRSGDLGVLVTTSGLAAGVNLPAQAVIVRDTVLGRTPLSTGDAVQMLGRAGRFGFTSEGYGFLLAPFEQVAQCSGELAEGHQVHSQILDTLADHLLADIHLGRVDTLDEVRSWFSGTYAAWEGQARDAPLDAAVDLLIAVGMVTADTDGVLAVTDLGRLTTQFLIPVPDAVAILSALRNTSVPSGEPAFAAQAAEATVLTAVACSVTTLATAPVPTFDAYVEKLDAALAKTGMTSTLQRSGVSAADLPPGARKTLLAAATALGLPARLAGRGEVGPFRATELVDLLDDGLARPLAWLAALGPTGAIDWQAPVAADMSARIAARSATPAPGSGRLLRFFTSMLPVTNHRAAGVLYHRALTRSWTSPEMVCQKPTTVAVTDADWARACQRRAILRITGVTVVGGADAPCLRVDIEIPAGTDQMVTATARAGRAPTVARAEHYSGRGLDVPVPPGATTGQVAVEVFGFSAGDWAYDETVADVDIPIGDTASLLTNLLDALPATTTLAPRTGPLRRLFTSTTTKRRRTQMAVLAGTHDRLTPLAEYLAGDATTPVRLWTLRLGLVELLGKTEQPADQVRTPEAVLRSRMASRAEAALTLACTAQALGVNVDLAEAPDETPVPIVVLTEGRRILAWPGTPDGPLVPLSGVDMTETLEHIGPPPPPPPIVRPTGRYGFLSAFRAVQS